MIPAGCALILVIGLGLIYWWTRRDARRTITIDITPDTRAFDNNMRRAAELTRGLDPARSEAIARADEHRSSGYTLTEEGDAVAQAIITAILEGREPLAVKVFRHPSGLFADVVCAGDAIEGAEAILRDGAA